MPEGVHLWNHRPYETITVKKVAGALGAEISGVDLREPLTDDLFDEIYTAFVEHQVIFFRDQDMSPEQYLAFAKRWGEIHLHPHMPCLDGYPGIIEIEKKETDTVAFGGNWHTDQMFTATPARVTMLYAKEVPPAGGDTMFANLYLAYDSLSDGMKEMIGDLRTVNQYNKKKIRPAAMTPTEIEVEFEINGEKTLRRMKRWLSWSHAWCHSGVLDRRKSIATRLRTIEAAGELTILNNPLGDVASIIEHITRIKDMGLLGGVAVDASGLGEMEDALDEIGVTQEAKLLVAAPQGGWMMSSIKGAERRLASGLLKHCGGPLMQWCVPNLKIEPTATGIRATKQSAGDAKIDPAMAMFNAVTLMARNPVAEGPSVYKARGALVL